MPVGDSMTIGSAGEHTWRYRMWRHLRDTYGGPFALVGPREALHDPAADAPTSYEYADPDFPRGHLAGWMADAQSVKPGVRMPPNPLPPDDLQALLDYLETLK